MTTQTTAEAFANSYGEAMHSGRLPTTTPQACAEALVKHYLPGFTAFVCGIQARVGNSEEALARVTAYLEKFEKYGLGMDVRLKNVKVQVVSEGSALCWMTWEVHPKDGKQGWDWENVYAYRKMEDGREGWEFSVSDNETKMLAKNWPQILTG